jgi:hypothetical protein
MGDIINLDERRRQRARKDKSAQASVNRAKFGRSKVDRQQQDAEKAAEVRKLDGARRDQATDEDKNA